MVTEDSKILLHRFNWQRLWTISHGDYLSIFLPFRQFIWFLLAEFVLPVCPFFMCILFCFRTREFIPNSIILVNLLSWLMALDAYSIGRYWVLLLMYIFVCLYSHMERCSDFSLSTVILLLYLNLG